MFTFMWVKNQFSGCVEASTQILDKIKPPKWAHVEMADVMSNGKTRFILYPQSVLSIDNAKEEGRRLDHLHFDVRKRQKYSSKIILIWFYGVEKVKPPFLSFSA